MSSDPFAVLSLEPMFDLDMSALQRAYLDAQQTTHPDRLPSTATPAERLKAMQHSMALNDAYQTLRSPLARAQALLAAQGIRVGGERDTHKPSTPLLMEVMEWREALAGADLPAIGFQITELQEVAKHTERQLAFQLGNDEWDEATQTTLRLQYLDKTLQDAKAKRRQLAARAPTSPSGQ